VIPFLPESEYLEEDRQVWLDAVQWWIENRETGDCNPVEEAYTAALWADEIVKRYRKAFKDE
jgi:hypothetical protein